MKEWQRSHWGYLQTSWIFTADKTTLYYILLKSVKYSDSRITTSENKLGKFSWKFSIISYHWWYNLYQSTNESNDFLQFHHHPTCPIHYHLQLRCTLAWVSLSARVWTYRGSKPHTPRRTYVMQSLCTPLTSLPILFLSLRAIQHTKYTHALSYLHLWFSFLWNINLSDLHGSTLSLFITSFMFLFKYHLLRNLSWPANVEL